MKMLFLMIALCGLASTAALAEGVATSARPACAPVTTARLVTTGEAFLSRGGSFAEARDGAELIAGDRVTIRGAGASVFAGRELLARAAAGTLLAIDRKDGQLCVVRISTDPTVVGAAGVDKKSDCTKQKNDKKDSDWEDLCGWAPAAGVDGVLGPLLGVTTVGAGVGAAVAVTGDKGKGDDKTSILILVNSLSRQ
jgi:hypothetical protein